jgi:hypothetical protein
MVERLAGFLRLSCSFAGNRWKPPHRGIDWPTRGPHPSHLDDMKYPSVKNAHIVPATYLRNFAVDGKIGVHLVREDLDLVQRVEAVGTRSYFYRRKRPDGTYIDDIEWSLGQLEGIATPVLRDFEERWPLDDVDKQKLAELFAFQLLRGTRYKAEYEAMTQRFIDDYKEREDMAHVAPEEMSAFDEALIGDSYRLQRMLVMSMTLTSISSPRTGRSSSSRRPCSRPPTTPSWSGRRWIVDAARRPRPRDGRPR